MHCTPGMSNRLKWPINDEIWYEKVVWKIAPPEPIHSGRRTGVTRFNFLNATLSVNNSLSNFNNSFVKIYDLMPFFHELREHEYLKWSLFYLHSLHARLNSQYETWS